MIAGADSFGKVAVLLGGQSAEREISLKSGEAVLAALRRRGVDATAVDVGSDIVTRLTRGGFDRAFVALHGRGGEDGVIQGVLETLGLPYTGSRVAGSAIGMDKYRSKLIWKGLGLPTPAFRLVTDREKVESAGEQVGYPLMVKPAHEGSSIGMTKADDARALSEAWDTAARFDPMVMLERWVTGVEYTASILGQEALPLIRLKTPHAFYDFDAKYRAETTQYICPCGLDEAAEADLRKLALDAFRATGARGWGRVDLLVDEDGSPWLIEVNTVPGMTDHSLVPMAASAGGIDFDELVWRILETSIEDES